MLNVMVIVSSNVLWTWGFLRNCILHDLTTNQKVNRWGGGYVSLTVVIISFHSVYVYQTCCLSSRYLTFICQSYFKKTGQIIKLKYILLGEKVLLGTLPIRVPGF